MNYREVGQDLTLDEADRTVEALKALGYLD